MKELIKLLIKSEGETEALRIAKGKYQFPCTIKEVFQKLK